jgi:hypothetical protein
MGISFSPIRYVCQYIRPEPVLTLIWQNKVLLVINTRIVPLFVVRSVYSLIDTILPLAIHHQIRLFTPSIAISADGIVWLATFYTLIALANPAENWIGREAAYRVHGIQPVTTTTSSPSTDVENGRQAGDQGNDKPSKWSQRFALLSPFHKHKQYGSTDVREDNSSDQQVPEGSRTATEEGRPAPLPDVAIVHGVAASGTQVYAQTKPMAPAWLLQEAPVGGKVHATST